jgi:cytochrome c-type protein NapC
MIYNDPGVEAGVVITKPPMDPTGIVVVLLILLTLAAVAAVAARPSLSRDSGGKILAFFALFILPAAVALSGGIHHLERSKQTEFCLSCHTMSEHGRSLLIDDPSFLPATHYQYNRVPRETACYTCHTDYTMYGGLAAKWRGLRHVYVQYIGERPEPVAVKTYVPYNNRECLHCHLGARSFEEQSAHNAEARTLASIKSNAVSCLSSGCHEFVHEVELLGEVPLWNPGPTSEKSNAGSEN